MIKTASDCGLFHVKYAKRPAPKARGVPFSVFVLFGKAVAAGLVVRAAAGYLDGVELAVAALEVVAAFRYVAFDGIVAVHILILLFTALFGRFISVIMPVFSIFIRYLLTNPLRFGKILLCIRKEGEL